MCDGLTEATSLARAMHNNLPEGMQWPLVESLEFLLEAMIKTEDISIYPEYLHHSAVCQLLQSKIDRLLAGPKLIRSALNASLQMIADLYDYEHEVICLDYPSVIANLLWRYEAIFERGFGYLYLFGQTDYSDSIYVHDFELDLPSWLRVVSVSQ